jgi:hypothetical protein
MSGWRAVVRAGWRSGYLSGWAVSDYASAEVLLVVNAVLLRLSDGSLLRVR